MLLALKIAIIKNGIRQSRMAVDLGWDPSKLSRIIHRITVPTVDDRRSIAQYLGVGESELFADAVGVGGADRALEGSA